MTVTGKRVSGSGEAAAMLHETPPLVALPSGGALHVAGPPGGIPLLFLHGVGGAAWSWRYQVEALSPAYRTFVWEARGHGEAARVNDAGLADYYTDAREALAVAVAESGTAPFVVGHSMGGLLAIALACEEALHVRGLFLVDPVYADGSGDYGHFSPHLGSLALWLCSPLLRSFERDGAVSRKVARWMFEQSFEDRARMEACWPEQRKQIPIEYPRMLRESFGTPTGFELRDFASEITQPVSLLEGTGGHGKPRFGKFVSRLRETLGSNFTHATIAGGHYLQADRPDEVNARLIDFISAQTTSAGFPLRESKPA